MKLGSAGMIIGTALILGIVAAAGFFCGRNVERGVLWSTNLGLGGSDLRLFDSGRYELSDWGDLLPYPPPVKGVWRWQGERLFLIPDSPLDPIKTYRKIDKFGCTYLRRPGLLFPRDLFPSGITAADLAIEGSGCKEKAKEQDGILRHTKNP